MWQMIAGPDLRCTECRHTIQTGRLCLSDLPEETPPGIERRNSRHFCIGCPQCWAQGKHACYLRHLDAQRPTGTVPRNLPCARCGVRIKAGGKAGIDIYYDWPEAAEAVRTSSLSSILGTAVAVTSMGILIRGVPSNSFTELSKSLRIKFARAGLGAGQRHQKHPRDAALFSRHHPVPDPEFGGRRGTAFPGRQGSQPHSIGPQRPASCCREHQLCLGKSQPQPCSGPRRHDRGTTITDPSNQRIQRFGDRIPRLPPIGRHSRVLRSDDGKPQ